MMYDNEVNDTFERLCHFLIQCLNSPLQKRLTEKDQKISENFFARGDGTVCTPSFFEIKVETESSYTMNENESRGFGRSPWFS